MSLNKRKRSALDDSDDEEEIAPGRQILPVANLPQDFSGEPEDGSQYLFLVRRDARKLPMVTRAANPHEKVAPSLPPPRNMAASHPSLPSDHWRDLYESRFRNFRKNMRQPTIHVPILQTDHQKLMPDKNERDLWWAFLEGKPESEWNPPKQSKPKSRMRAFTPEAEADGASETWHINDEGEVELALKVDPAESLPTPPPGDSQPTEPSCKPRPPTPMLLKHVDQRMSLHLLMYFTHWINQHLNNGHPRISEVHAQWMFVLLTQVENHISADSMNLLRNLARACIALLKVILREEASGNEQPTFELDRGIRLTSASCWIIISTVVGIWGQRDLWADARDMLLSIEVPQSSCK
ncbi:survival motor neuron interacting protein 1-domain-containing protein [Mycena floridula]|nr:survival motor neuron interacting protein 1-domain-containing protein [Mycena floridula]